MRHNIYIVFYSFICLPIFNYLFFVFTLDSFLRMHLIFPSGNDEGLKGFISYCYFIGLLFEVNECSKRVKWDRVLM